MNILIIDDHIPHFEEIKKKLEEKLQDSVSIYPLVADRAIENFSSSNYLIGQINSHNFEAVLQSYNKIDIFIIDIYLKGNEKNGLKFAQFILNTQNGNFKIILISNYRLKDEVILKDNRVTSLHKRDYGIDFPEPLCKLVAKTILELEN